MNYLLFTTTRCPKCPAFKEYVEKNVNFPGEILDENHPDFPEKSMDYGITVAPTMIILNENGEELIQINEVDELEGFLKSHS